MLLLKTDLETYSQADLERDLALIPQWRREKALRYRHFRGQMECTLSFRMLQEGLKELGNLETQELRNLEFIENEHGKPSLKGFPNIHFNISHCKHAIACIVDNEPVGIDVEDLGRYSESLARYCMNDLEMSQIVSPQPSPSGEGGSEAIFTSLWTQKEAVFKLQGTGIRDNLKDILLPENIGNIELTTTEYDKFVLSVARYRQNQPK